MKILFILTPAVYILSSCGSEKSNSPDYGLINNGKVFISVYSGGKCIERDTFLSKNFDPMNRASDLHYTKGDTDVQVYNEIIIKTVKFP
jgi:hypothetical protein